MDERSEKRTGDRWTYWCPPEGTHVSHPNELWVGTVDVNGDPTRVAAVVPAWEDMQQESTAIAILTALSGRTTQDDAT